MDGVLRSSGRDLCVVSCGRPPAAPIERPSWRTSYCGVSGKLVLMSHGFGGLGLRRRACMMTLGSRQTGLTGQRPMAGHALHLEDTRGEVGARACSWGSRTLGDRPVG